MSAPARGLSNRSLGRRAPNGLDAPPDAARPCACRRCALVGRIAGAVARPRRRRSRERRPAFADGVRARRRRILDSAAVEPQQVPARPRRRPASRSAWRSSPKRTTSVTSRSCGASRAPTREFLGIELSLVFKGPLLVVMPDGFGLYWPGHATPRPTRALSGAPRSRRAAPDCSPRRRRRSAGSPARPG